MTIIHHGHPLRLTACHLGRIAARIRGKGTSQADRYCPVHGYYPAYFGVCPRCGR